MRVTFNSVHNNSKSVIQKSYAELAQLQKKMITGKALTRPSDGPVETANAIKLKTQNVKLQQYETNINDAQAWMQVTDTALTSMNTILQRVRELAIEGDNDTLSATERKYITEEIEQLTLQMVALANTRYKGDYIFSGSETNKTTILLKESNSNPLNIQNNEMAYFDGTAGTIQLMDPNGVSWLRSSNTVTQIIPGSLSIKVDGVEMKENVDYKVDYMTGQLTIIDAEDKYYPNENPDWDGVDPATRYMPQHPMEQNFTPQVDGDGRFTLGGYGATGTSKLEINLTYMDKSRDDIYNDYINTNSSIYRQIEDGAAVVINTPIDSLAIDSGNNIFIALVKLGQSLMGSPIDHESVNSAISAIDQNIDQILATQAKNGALINRLELTLERNENQQVEVTRLQSNLEDADYADVITDYMVKETIYNVALNAVSRIMQTSLADYLR